MPDTREVFSAVATGPIQIELPGASMRLIQISFASVVLRDFVSRKCPDKDGLQLFSFEFRPSDSV